MSKSECCIYYILFTNQIKPLNNWFISRRLLDSHVCSFLKNTNILADGHGALNIYNIIYSLSARRI